MSVLKFDDCLAFQMYCWHIKLYLAVKVSDHLHTLHLYLRYCIRYLCFVLYMYFCDSNCICYFYLRYFIHRICICFMYSLLNILWISDFK